MNKFLSNFFIFIWKNARIKYFELRSKVLTFEKSQINLDFCSLNRTFAA